MAQLTVRARDDLVDRVKAAARATGRSMNDYVVSVLDAATDPDLAGSEAEQLRARLDQVGLLAKPPRRPGRRPSPGVVARAGERATQGRPLSDIVTEDR
jgi:hypothetical protein